MLQGLPGVDTEELYSGIGFSLSFFDSSITSHLELVRVVHPVQQRMRYGCGSNCLYPDLKLPGSSTVNSIAINAQRY